MDNYAHNVKYIYDGSVFKAEEPIYLPEDNSALFYRAVYPYNSKYTKTFSFEVFGDQSLNNNYTLSDLMTANTNASTEEIPALVFDHRLSNIIVNIEYEERPAGVEKLYLNNVKRWVTVDLNNNTFESNGTGYEIVAAPNGTSSFRAIVPPQTIAAGTTILTLYVGSHSFSFYIENDLEWRSGKQYTYNLYVNKRGEISFTGSINPWNTTPDIEEIIPPSLLDTMESYITIYRGSTPPNIENVYLFEPETVYCSDDIYEPGETINQYLVRFTNQNNQTQIINYESKYHNGDHSSGVGYIYGSQNNFSVYIIEENETTYGEYSAWSRSATVISGTQTSSGILNYQDAFVMLEKEDPNNILMAVGEFRVFKDTNNLAAISDWDLFTAATTSRAGDHVTNPRFEFIRAK